MKQLKFCLKWSGNCIHDFFSSIKNPNPENRLFFVCFVFFVFSYLVQLMSYYMRLQCIHRWTKKNKQCLLYYRDNLVEKKKKANARRKNTPQLTITDGCALLSNHTLVLFKLVAREKKKKKWKWVRNPDK